MRFHLPTPIHGWRAFAGEVGIIVVGVLIALGAQQMVENADWRQRARGADLALRDELSSDYVFADEVVVTAPCVDRQLEALEQRLVAGQGSYVPAPIYVEKLGTFTFRAPGRPWADDVWRSVVAEGLPSHFDRKLRDHLANFYEQVRTMRDNVTDTQLLGWRLRVLSRPVSLDAATRARLTEEVEEARGRFEFNKVVGNQLLGRLQAMGRAPTAQAVAENRRLSGTIAFCRAHGLPLGKAEPVPPRV